MTVKFNTSFFASSLVLLILEICIAAYFTEGFIRHTFGDFLATILMYCGLRSLFQFKAINLAIGVCTFAFLIEFLQLFNFLEYINLSDNPLAVIILGSTFEFTDLIAYTLGVITIFLIDTKISLSWKP